MPDSPSTARTGLPAWRSLLEWFGLDDDWERPIPAVSKRDIAIVATVWFSGILCLELTRGYLDLGDLKPRVVEYLTMAVMVAPLIWRRRFPCISALVTFALFVSVSYLVPELGAQLILQIILFMSMYAVAAWSRQRQAMVFTIVAIVLADLLWLTWAFAVQSGVDQIIGISQGTEFDGILDPIVSYVSYQFFMNLVFFSAATGFGIASWRQAKDRSLGAAQAQTITEQAAQLQDQAIINERLRIARELHDVVAHHVSVTGVQSAAARKLLSRDPDKAAAALVTVEESSREAIAQMRGLLGTLRGGQSVESRESSPTLSQIPELISQQPGLTVDYDLIKDPPGAHDAIPPAESLTIYRTVEEALTNIRHHSTATKATVTIRIKAGNHIEAEILDEGRLRPDTSGTGLGQLGIRERVQSHHGQVEIGPRITGGYRVRVRLPLLPQDHS